MTEKKDGRAGRFAKRLSHSEYFRLCTWLACEGERLMKDEPLYVDAARQASEALGYKVSENTMLEACKDVNVVWKPKMLQRREANRQGRETVNSYGEILASLQQEVASLQGENRRLVADIALLRGAISQICADGGIPVPAGIVPETQARRRARPHAPPRARAAACAR